MLRTTLRNLLAHQARLAMTALAICLGVAFVSGTLVFADSSAAAYRAAASKDFADVAVTVTPKDPPSGPPTGPPPFWTTRSREHWPACPVSPPCGRRSTARRCSPPRTALRCGPARPGRTWPPATCPARTARTSLSAGQGHAPGTQNELAVDAGTAAAGRFALGDTVRLATDGPVMTKRLVGIVATRDSRVTAGGTLALFDAATAQRLFASRATTPGSTCPPRPAPIRPCSRTGSARCSRPTGPRPSAAPPRPPNRPATSTR
ncbi:hypothetical protein O1L55_17945 [Streptomyces albulus]|nr:hypothetical protein [Streptomyces noursei]